MKDSIAARMKAGPTLGFDYLRLFLCLTVVAWHSVYISGDPHALRAVLNTWLGPVKALTLPMFFSLSGFLVAKSMERADTLEGFAVLRILRIAPALAVQALFLVFVLGAVVTSLPLPRYFAAPHTWAYLLTMLGDIHYSLPGVFLNNPVRGTVNLSLWTLPFELLCYALLMGLTKLGYFRRPAMFLGVSLALNIGLWLVYLILRPHGPGSAEVMTMPGPGLVISFLAGVCVYLLRDRLKVQAGLAVLAFLAAVLLLHAPRFMVFAAFPAAYLTVYAGLQNPPSNRFIRSGTYSYGIYVCAFPIQQVLAMSPAFRVWTFNLAASVVISLVYAICSWHFVEKRALGRKRQVIALVEAVSARWRRGGEEGAAETTGAVT